MNIYDVAKAAGVSITTVSRVLNDNGRVSEKTKQKVRKIMEEMNYTPSQLAVGLATSTTKTIGIMVPDVRDSFHAEVAYLIESKMIEKGYNCILCNTSVGNNKEADYLNTLYGKNVDGIILVGSSYHSMKIENTYKAWKTSIPIVLINALSGAGTASVLCDEEYGILQALKHLHGKGRRHPIFLKDSASYQSRASVTKGRAFELGMEKVYQVDGKGHIYTCKPEVEAYRKLIRKIEKEPVDAVLFTSDLCCALFLKAMEKEGLSAPEKYALVGFNNASITELTSPTLTTIDHMVEAHCSTVIEKLFQMIKGEEVEKVTYIKPTFVEKETT